ncbi:glycosyltransferase family 2 protein [Streptomyces sp. AP-93]|uniref:glycosyltransferase family 2 protein n=1 Tax=Streptomyces sp. AP-93 TaxID=2929048 RepID=UPI001FAE86B9|nr:glycosyltransferase family 2 protein [Streptomyces sp. AP-93]MCJ0874285.1 glycosyltransferase family 2 protein [Streptomyces sp. AP-93]
MSETVTVDVVLPCLNEAEALPWVLARIPAGWRALVVDNGSTDGSAELARALGATVVTESRRGFGAACHAGLLAAEADVVCFCDCDASLDPGLLTGFVAAVAAGEADLVLGRRRPQGRGAWPAHARAGNLALARLLSRRTGLRLRDLGPMRAARREGLLGLDLSDRRSGYPLQMVVRAADAGWRIREVDVPYLPRSGKSKVTGTWRGTWQAVRDMSRVLAQPADGRAPGRAGAGTPSGGAPSGGAPSGGAPSGGAR